MQLKHVLVTGSKDMPWPVEKFGSSEIESGSVLTENYEAVAKCYVGHLQYFSYKYLGCNRLQLVDN